MLWFINFTGLENFIFKNGGREGMLGFSLENSFSHRAEKFRKGTLIVSLNSGVGKF